MEIFITNSSSASFILTAKEDIIDLNIAHFEKKGKIGIVQLLRFIKEEMKHNGSKTKIGDKKSILPRKNSAQGKTFSWEMIWIQKTFPRLILLI